MIFVAPESLKMPEDLLEELKKQNVDFVETKDLQKAIDESDILYMTRIQRERFPDPIEYEKVKGVYVITKDMIEGAKKLKIMHPLPRVNEIAKDVDDTKNAIYFEQAKNGVTVRQALLAMLLGKLK
jgi:aspartate carbamoyltransferase catalytic subunit